MKIKILLLFFIWGLCIGLEAQNNPSSSRGKDRYNQIPVYQVDKKKIQHLPPATPPKAPRPEKPSRDERHVKDDKMVKPEKEDKINRMERPPRPDMPRMGKVENVSRNYYGYGRKSTPPSRSRIVYHSGVGYRYYKGVYYKPYVKGEWVISRPPIGVVVAAVMLEGLKDVVIPRGVITTYPRYRYDDGVFYVEDPTHNYCVVTPPVGALVEVLPSGCERVIKGNEVFFIVDKYRYTPVNYEGKRMYRVDGKIMK